MTFPRNVGQIPLYYNHKNTGRPSIPAPGLVFWSHYTDESNEALYPFGHGLSYTQFEYSNLEIVDKYDAEGVITVKVSLKNIGDYVGKEVVQLYLHDLAASITRPVRELKRLPSNKVSPRRITNCGIYFDR